MPFPPGLTIAALSNQLDAGATNVYTLAEQALARIQDPEGEGARAFIHVDTAQVLTEAAARDKLQQAAGRRSPIDGVPISIKDLFDVAGQVTKAGSRVLADHAAASHDATIVARLKAAGALLVGRTNMTEFAYSGLGINPHYGTPGNPYDSARIPGGSSSGGAVSVADGMAAATIGSDTGGSTRIPAAFCGIVGFKPSHGRIPLDGTIPLATSLDTIGPMAPSVDCVGLLYSILAGEPVRHPQPRPVANLRLGVPENVVFDSADNAVTDAFEQACRQLSDAGAAIRYFRFEALNALPELREHGGLIASEAWTWHRRLLSTGEALYDPRVGSRIKFGAEATAADYIDLLNARRRICTAAHQETRLYDAVMMPSVAILPPRMDALQADADYYRLNQLILRNTSIGNQLDRTAISLPLAVVTGGLPVGLMLMGEHGSDHHLLGIAAGVEHALNN